MLIKAIIDIIGKSVVMDFGVLRMEYKS